MSQFLSLSRLRQLTEDPHILLAEGLIARARWAIAMGQRAEARRLLWATLAVHPESVTALLILAALASPRPSLEYITHALELRPRAPLPPPPFTPLPPPSLPPPPANVGSTLTSRANNSPPTKARQPCRRSASPPARR